MLGFMGVFKDLLKADESLFRDTIPLDFDYIPKILKYREASQKKFAYAIKPLLQDRSGRNLFVYGAPGVGKTVACKHVLRELEEETDDVVTIYLNCWKHNTPFKMLLEMCNQLGIRLITNQKTSELFNKIKMVVNKKKAVFVFDEIDKADVLDVLYMVLEDIYKKSVFLITNYRNKVEEMDERVLSRLNPEFVEFGPYSEIETKGILLERMKYAFVPGVWTDSAIVKVVEKTSKLGDIRQGLFLLREAGTVAEDEACKNITELHVNKAIMKVDQFSINAYAGLDESLRNILELVKRNSGMKIGDLFQLYLQKGGEMSYKTFSRKIDKLEKGKFVVGEKVTGKNGNTTLVHTIGSHKPARNSAEEVIGEKKLTEY
jgi:archaeal cell division control protein 6